MRCLHCILLMAATLVAEASPQREADTLVLVHGGAFTNPKSTNYYGRNIVLPNFYIAPYEVTQKEWVQVMGSNPSQFIGDGLPVDSVSWYDCVDYCNQRSRKEGLAPCYTIDKNRKDPNNHTVVDDVKWTVTLLAGANGYRLPSEAEWEYAAGGGQQSQKHTYSGANNIEQVAWYWRNSGDTNLTGFWRWQTIQKNHCRTKPVGAKAPNELGLYDMAGNVREWCWDWYGDLQASGMSSDSSSSETGRVWKGGGWMGGEFCCEPSFRGSYEANGCGSDQGFRVCRSAVPGLQTHVSAAASEAAASPTNDPVIVTATGFSIKRSELDQVLARAKANAKADGLSWQPQMQVFHLDQLIRIQVLLQKANAADQATGRLEADTQFTNALKHSPAPELLVRELESQGITETEFRAKILQDAVATAALKRLLAISVTEDEARQYYNQHRETFKLPEVDFITAEPDLKIFLSNLKLAETAPAYIRKLRAEQKVEVLDPDLKALDDQVQSGVARSIPTAESSRTATPQ